MGAYICGDASIGFSLGLCSKCHRLKTGNKKPQFLRYGCPICRSLEAPESSKCNDLRSSVSPVSSTSDSCTNLRKNQTNRGRFPRYIIEYFDDDKLYFALDAEDGKHFGTQTCLNDDLKHGRIHGLLKDVKSRRKKVKLILRGKSFRCFRKRYYHK